MSFSSSRYLRALVKQSFIACTLQPASALHLFCPKLFLECMHDESKSKVLTCHWRYGKKYWHPAHILLTCFCAKSGEIEGISFRSFQIVTLGPTSALKEGYSFDSLFREGFKKNTGKKRSVWPLWGGRGGHPPSAWPLLFVKIWTHFCPL